jgi:hypothetical protein
MRVWCVLQSDFSKFKLFKFRRRFLLSTFFLFTSDIDEWSFE